MRKNSIKSIDIDVYFDARNADYYVRLVFSGNEELPGFDEMSPEQKQALYTEFPELVKLGKKPREETIEEIIDPKIKEYNERHPNTLRTKWKVYVGEVLVQINQAAIIKKLEKQFGNFVSIKYVGSADDVAIISFIEDYKSNAKVQFMAYNCGKCKQWRYGKVVNKKVRCQCGSIFSTNDNEVFLFTGDNALTQAAEKTIEKNSSQSVDQTVESKARSFYYKGTTYGLNLREFKVLHEVLYNDCAVNSIFVKDETGRIKFQPDYENYLRAISEKKIDGDLTELYKKKVRIIGEINSASNYICGVMPGFYWYFKEYGLTKSTALCWRVGNTQYSYDSPAVYVAEFCSAPVTIKEELISLYNEQTCQYFFQGYDSRRIELSRLIFENTGGKYIYIDENNKVTDFGADFIRHLSAVDDQIATKNEFILAIHGDEAFWELVKGSYDLDDGYWSTSGETYYDLLCYYQFAIMGKSVLNFRSLQIRNSKEGMEYIRAIVSNAYLKSDEMTQKRYHDLISLIFHTSLLDKLVFRNEGIIKAGQTGTLPLIDTLMGLLDPTEIAPSIKAYLFCLSSVDKRVKFQYSGRIDTLLGHAKHQNNAVTNGNNALAEYIASSEVQELLQYIFADRYDTILADTTGAFQTLKQNLDDLRRGIDKKIQDISYARATGRDDIVSNVSSAPQPMTPSAPVQRSEVSRTSVTVSQEEDDTDEWA